MIILNQSRRTSMLARLHTPCFVRPSGPAATFVFVRATRSFKFLCEIGESTTSNGIGGSASPNSGGFI